MRKNARQITAFGRTESLAKWAELSALGVTTILGRLRWGWSPERSVSEASHWSMEGGYDPGSGKPKGLQSGLNVSRPRSAG